MTKAETEEVLSQLVGALKLTSDQVTQNTQDLKESFPEFHRLKKRIRDLEERVKELDQRTIISQPFNSARFK